MFFLRAVLKRISFIFFVVCFKGKSKKYVRCDVRAPDGFEIRSGAYTPHSDIILDKNSRIESEKVEEFLQIPLVNY